MKLSLIHKSLILVSIPLFFELIFVGTLVFLQNQAEAQAQRALHSEKVSTSINKLISQIYDMASKSRGEISNFLAPEKYDSTIARLKAGLNELRDSVKDNPAELAIVEKSTAAAQEAEHIIDGLRKIYQEGDSYRLIEEFNSSRATLRACLKRIISPQVIEMGNLEKENQEKSPFVQAEFRHQTMSLLLGGAIANIFLTVIVAFILTKQVIARLLNLESNTVKLAARMPLNPPMKGADEIATVDQSFHWMANELEKAKLRAKEVIDNAADVICSLTSDLQFDSVNRTCKSMFGYDDTDLVNKSAIYLIVEKDRPVAVKTLQSAIENRAVSTFDTAIRRKDGHILDVSWNTHWSESTGLMSCVIRDISERKLAERTRQEVIAMVTHDLKSPLAVIKGFHEMLGYEMFGILSEKGRELLAVAEQTTDQMLTLINDLLEVEKIRSGHFKISLSNFDLSQLFKHTVDSLTEWAKSRGVELAYSLTSSFVYGDSNRVIQVLTNLLSNAVKFSNNGSTVTLSSKEENGMITVSVTDTGRGIPVDMRQRIFERFRQVDATDATEKGGTGLGLAICKAIVELHGGTIWVDENPGGGSIFRFTLPLNEAV